MQFARFARDPRSTSQNQLGTDALNALIEIVGVSHPQVVEDSPDEVLISYSIVGGASNLGAEIEMIYVRHGVKRIG